MIPFQEDSLRSSGRIRCGNQTYQKTKRESRKRLAQTMTKCACYVEKAMVISFLCLTNSLNALDESEYAGMAQSVERRIGSAEVPGPIPGASW